MEYTVIISNQFKKDFRRCIRRGLDMIRLVIAPPQFPPQPTERDFIRRGCRSAALAESVLWQ